MKIEGNFTEKKQWNSRKSLIGLLLFTFIAVAGTLAYWLIGAHFAWARSNVSPKIERTEETEYYGTLPGKLNIVLLGVDERLKDGDPGRSDTLLVMMIDTMTREVSLISIPRDTRVRIKGLGWDKINHAFADGGVALTQQTTERFLGIPMNYYAKVDLESFGRVVDAIGGVMIDVDQRMQYEDTWEHFVIDLQPGLQRLDGKTALQYVRYRDDEGDIGRVRRQQKFIKAVIAEMSTLSIIVKLPSIIREVSAALDTNMPMPVMLGLARQLKEGMSAGLKVHMVEGLPYYINDISYWVPDVMKLSRKVAEMQGVPFSGNVQVAAQRMADEYQRNLPANAHLDDGNYYATIDPPQAKRAPPAQTAFPAFTTTAPTVTSKPMTKTMQPLAVRKATP
ncbi:MAG TPA: LCP family protein [Negativicutes bacterium]|nr:LCP family protein [Negativicutes bacterium]